MNTITITEILDRLCREFPAAFVHYQGRRRPLKVGIFHDILDRLGPAIDQKLLRRALGVDSPEIKAGQRTTRPRGQCRPALQVSLRQSGLC